MGDLVVPVARNLETDEFQVAFVGEHKKFRKGYYTIKFYGEDEYFALKAATKAGKAPEVVKPSFTVDVYHPVNHQLS